MPETTDGRAARRDDAHEIMDCSYCEQRTTSWCPECFGGPSCCPPEHEHCDRCGQSLVRCEATLCAGTAGDPTDQQPSTTSPHVRPIHTPNAPSRTRQGFSA